jgi:hypothetical protein
VAEQSRATYTTITAGIAEIGMTISRVLFSLIGSAVVFIASPSAKADPRAVIELFTSQGCSSCPAADRLLAELQADPSLIPLSLPIDYWDYLGWKDTLAIPGHTLRQRAYSQARGDREIYTPQAVVNGIAQVVGSDRTGIENAVTQSRSNASSLSVPLRMTVADEHVSVTIPERGHSEAGGGEVWLCALSGSVSVGIARGENRGRTITYTNVVRRWIKLGGWTGKSESFSVPIDAIKFDGVDAVAVILQTGSFEKPGAIMGAASASLN